MANPATLSDQMKLDAINDGLLSGADTWGVHLGTESVTIAPGNGLGAFTEAGYTNYHPSSWNPNPIAINGSHYAVAVPGSCTFGGPATGSVSIFNVFVTYTDASDEQQLMESFALPGAPLIMSSPSTTLTVNLAFDDFDANLS